MLKRYLLFFLILLTITLSVSSISASDAVNATLETDLSDDSISGFSDLTNTVNLSSGNEYDILESDTNTVATGSFDDLSYEINNTPEGTILVLDKDYEFVNGSYHGIHISKSITIDGDGHTLNGNGLSRIFNISADNVVLKNINFINGNALGSYGKYYGGGAIYWNGTDGYLENCNFTNNTALGLEYDPYDQEETYDENGISVVISIPRPVGCTINQGGAITWDGNNGKMANCTFKNNRVSYPDDGGAIFWAGANGSIINSEFYDNYAFRGAAIYWEGVNGTISLSKFLNLGICDNGIFWVGQNGLIKYSFLLSDGMNCVISPYSVNVNANFNFWGDTVDNPNIANKSSNVVYWILMDYNADRDFVFEEDSFAINYNFNSVMDNAGKLYLFKGLAQKAGIINFTSDETGILNVSYIKNNFTFNVSAHDSVGDFYDLLVKIRNTPEGGVLVVDRDYEFTTGFNKGIQISKSITIDGAGHTLNGNKISRIFNITADNVTIQNVNFVNGNAYGRYYCENVGGGAIYWSANNGYLFNCSFENNTGNGIENDPFDLVEISVDEHGRIWNGVRARPMGTKTNEGGAILWIGTKGTVDKCLFKNNGVGYPNSGGAICWRGDFGKVISSEFISNDAWAGSAICWFGENGSIISSNFLDNGMGSAIMWFADTGNISDSILLDSLRSALYIYKGNVAADNNWWGDTVNDFNKTSKPIQISSWLVLNFTADKSIVYSGDEVTVNCSLKYLTDSSGIFREYASDLLDFNLYLNNGDVIRLVNGTGQYKFKAASTGLINGISITGGKIKVNIDSLSKIKSRDLTKLYKSSKQFKIRVFGDDGKVAAGKIVNLTINKKTYHARTDKDGYATLNINLKPGKYSVTAQYGKEKVKNSIVVKSTLITKDISKKVKSSARFYIKVLKKTGKVYPKKTVVIKFSGKTYKVKTNSKGIASFAIPKNLKVGKYAIKITCNSLSNTNKIIVKK